MQRSRLALFAIFLLLVTTLGQDQDDIEEENEPEDFYPTVMVALLVRNKAGVLPYTLTLLQDLDYPKDRMSLFIRSDHNEDDTAEVLNVWLAQTAARYHSVNVSIAEEWGVLTKGKHGATAWEDDRFRHIMTLKEEALKEARRMWADFVWFLDADVFIADPGMLKFLVKQGETVSAPLLKSLGRYSNFWAGMSSTYYYERTDQYDPILDRKELECFSVPMVHSCVLVDLRRRESRHLTFVPDKIPDYDGPFDDIIAFALSASSAAVPMYVCNQRPFGYIMLPLNEENVLSDDEANLVNLKLQFASDFGPLRTLDCLSKFAKNTPEKDRLGVDQIYMINLKRRPDRKAKMDFCFDQLGIEYKLVEAVDGRQMDSNYLSANGISMLPAFEEPYHKRRLTYGEIGCFMSHYHVWKDVLREGHELVIVLEDDIRFEPYFRSRLGRVMQELEGIKEDWDLVFLGRKILRDSDEPWLEGSNQLVRVGYTYWTLAYVLTRAGAEKLLKAEPLSKMVPVDEYLPIMYDRHPNETWKAYFDPRDLNALSVHPLLVHPTHYTGEDGYFSDTEDTATIAANAAESKSQQGRTEIKDEL